MSANPIITGVICTHNRERFLERCIRSLYDQTLGSSLYEVLVVDNGSTDGTREVCDRFSTHPNFRYVHEPVLGLSSARNRGWMAAKGRYVGYIDDDATEQRTWFEKALWSFENVDPVPEWVGGPIDLEWEVESPPWITDEYRVTLGWVNWGDEKRFLSGPDERLGGGNSFYLKSTLERLEGFDSRLGRVSDLLLSGEETQFQHRLKSMGGRLFYHPGIHIFHFVGRERTKPGFFYRRYYWGGITDFILSKTLQDILFEPIAQKQSDKSLISRAFTHCLNAIGLLVPEEKRSRAGFTYPMWPVESWRC